MSFRLIAKSSLALALFAATSFAYAKTSNNEILCPAVTTIQQASAKINATEVSDDSYVAYTSSPAFYASNLPWYIGVSITAQSVAEALTKGKEVVRNINAKAYEYALPLGGGNNFICVYQPGLVVAIGGELSGNLNSKLALFKH